MREAAHRLLDEILQRMEETGRGGWAEIAGPQRRRTDGEIAKRTLTLIVRDLTDYPEECLFCDGRGRVGASK